MGKYYITTPIYYVNAEPHIGHAYTQVIVDAVARYRRGLGDDVFFLTGTDEHGQKISKASLEAGREQGEEKLFVDDIVKRFKQVWKQLDISYDHFIRTTDPSHIKVVQELLKKIYDSGDIYQGEYDGWYCTPCETFWTDMQAEKGDCPECGRPVEKIKEKDYFFKMGEHQDWLRQYIEDNPQFIMPEFRKNEVLGMLNEGLPDLCISRPKNRMSWGVELPFDKDYVLYVWFDALINYLTGPREQNKFDTMWPADVHVIAKDILRHHAVYWPIMLKSAGLEMPGTVFAHGWWKMDKEKMSKSKGNIADPRVISENYGVDALRYFLLRTVALGLDGDFSEDALITVYNSDLANDLGNLLNRTLTMVEKYFDGTSPEADPEKADPEQNKRSDALKEHIIKMLPLFDQRMKDPGMLIKEAIEEVMKVVGKANKYIEESAPWKYGKAEDTDSIKVIMADLLEVLRGAALALLPVMPATSQKMWDQLGLEGEVRDNIDPEEFTGAGSGEDRRGREWRRFPAGTKVQKDDPIFPRIKK